MLASRIFSAAAIKLVGSHTWPWCHQELPSNIAASISAHGEESASCTSCCQISRFHCQKSPRRLGRKQNQKNPGWQKDSYGLLVKMLPSSVSSKTTEFNLAHLSFNLVMIGWLLLSLAIYRTMDVVHLAIARKPWTPVTVCLHPRTFTIHQAACSHQSPGEALQARETTRQLKRPLYNVLERQEKLLLPKMIRNM